ncbi:MAG: GNAT family protein [Bacteroidia bacterium]|nr:GNAT family protein [Bacteroidia bacterium]
MLLQADSALTIELIGLQHAAPLLELTNTSREHLRPWLTWVDFMQSEAQFQQFILNSRKRHADGQELPCVLVEQGRLAGRIGLYRIDSQHQTAEIGYWLGTAFQGRGIATRACRALAAYAFGGLGLNRIEIRCGTGNLRSQAVPERLGFAREGLLRQAEWLHGEFHDLYLYAMLRSQWQPAAGASQP